MHLSRITSLCRNLQGIVVIILLLLISLVTIPAHSKVPGLTPDEIDWLETHEHLRVQLAEDWPPYNYTEYGESKGYVNNYIHLIAEKLDLKVDFVSGFSWSEYVRMLESKQIDIITNMTVTPERQKRFLFSQKSVVDVFNGLLTLKNNIEHVDLEKLRGATLAVARGYAQEELLKLYYPDINLLLTNNLLDSIRQVMAGKASAAIGAHAVFNYYIAKHLLEEVKSVPVTGNILFPSAAHHLAVHPDNLLLLGLLDKSAASLSEVELNRLKQKWHLREGNGRHRQLSSQELEYLARKKDFALCVDPDWMPMESIRNNRHIGMAADYMQLLAEKLGVEMTLVPTQSWNQTLEFAGSRKCDIVSLAISTPERRLYLHFSNPYFKTPVVVATKESAPFIADFGALRGKRVGVKENYAFGHQLKEKYPEVEIVETTTLEQGLAMVHDGRLHGFIGSLPTLVYAIQQQFPAELKIAGNSGEELELRMGLRNDEPLLLSSMNKAIESIKAEEHQKILNRWVSVQYEEGTDYQLIFGILAGATILFGLLYSRQITLKGFNRRLQRSNREILKQSELLQKTQRQLLMTQYAIDSCSFPIFWIHHDAAPGKSRIVHANDAAAASLGYSPEELKRINPESIAATLVTPENRPQNKMGEQNFKWSPASVFRRKDGSTFPVELHISSFIYEERHYRFIFFSDITTQRDTEAKLHRSMKMEAVGLMAGGVAHDLNNILSGIASYPELLLYQLDDDHPIRPQLETIKRSGEQAAQIVDDLLTVARGVAAVRQTANLNTLIAGYFDSPEFQHLQDRFPRVRCSLHLDHELHNIHCSPLHIKKSVMNLVINGYEASPPEGTVKLSTYNHHIEAPSADNHYLEAGNYVVFEVEDSGPGIPDSAIAHIFEPFYSKKEMGKSGTGLGLSIVWNTAQDHDGCVTVEDSGQGARFHIFLPATREEVSETNELRVEKELLGNGEKILVIDDNPQQLDIARDILQTLGYTAHSASSGEKAIKRIRQENFDLLLLDMIMPPGISGRESYAAIREIHPHQKCVIVSGFSEDSDVKATLSMGAGVFIRKPYSLYRLAVAVKNTLSY